MIIENNDSRQGRSMRQQENKCHQYDRTVRYCWNHVYPTNN
jgi:hypothetical protein